MKQHLNPTITILAVLGFFAFISITVWSGVSSDLDIDYDLSPVISKEEASAAAVDFIQSHQKIVTNKSFVSFQTQKQLSGYLNKNNLAATYNKNYDDNFPVDFFQVEIKDPSGQRYLVDVHMKTSKIIGWMKVPPMEKKHTSYEINLAKSYIQTMGLNPDEFTAILQTSSGSQITFENRNKQIGESYLEVHISVYEDKVSSFQAKFNVPESYQIWMSEQDRSTSRMSIISLVISLLMIFTAAFFAIKYRRQISFSRGLLLTFIFLATSVIHNINNYPAYKAIFAVDQNSESMITVNIILSIGITFVMAAVVYLSLVTGDGLWRKDEKNLWPRWKDSFYGDHVIRSMGIGYLFCLIILGFQRIMFYVGENFFDVWSVNDPMFSNHNIWIPMLFPLLAWAAAISEEAIYRLLGIILFKKLVKNTFLAVLIPSMIWAMGHTQYPIYPAYTRFIEVTILGLIFGCILLKHGFITAIFTHVSVNSILMGLSLMGVPGGAAHSLTGLLYMTSPALAAYIIFLLHLNFNKGNATLSKLNPQTVVHSDPEEQK
jgi:hypothetical protein